MESIKANVQFRSRAALCTMILSLVTATTTFAQTFAEWFSQKKTQIKYLNQQIAALTQYGSYVKQGYRVSQDGLGTIDNWLKGEFDFHANYYTSLKRVSPVIGTNSKVDSIIRYAKQIPVRFDHLLHIGTLDAGNHDYIRQVRSVVTAACDQDLAELQTVMTHGKVRMTDDERIARLDEIHYRMKDTYAFTLFFCGQAKTLLLQLSRERQDANTLKYYYGITD